MNLPVLIAGIMSLLAFLVHAFVGDKELLAFKLNDNDQEKLKDTWVQMRAGWHWISIDLLLSGMVLLVIALTDIVGAKKEILILLSIYFAVAGLAWFVTVMMSKFNKKQIIMVGQWAFCFIQSALIYYASSVVV